MKNFIISLVVIVGAGGAFADATNQCLVKKREDRTPTSSQMIEIEACIKAGNCSEKQKDQICPWAAEKSKPRNQRLEDPDLLDNLNEQCKQLGIMACSLDLRAAMKKIERFNEVFLSPAGEGKPLVFGFRNPSFELNNLNVSANLAKLQADRATYQVELQKLTTDLKALSQSVSTEDEVRSKIKKSQSLIDSFDNKWNAHAKSIVEMEDLLQRAGIILMDWYGRLLALKEDELCSGVMPEIEKGIADSLYLVKTFNSALSSLQEVDIRKNTNGLRIFTETAIKLRYVSTAKTSLENLEKSLGSVLKLDFDLADANRWWYRASSNGLADGLHTRYFQFREPLRRLYLESAKGQEFINRFQKNTTAPPSAVSAAINIQRTRIQQVQADITWLESRGWVGQFKDQKVTVQMWLEDPGNAFCKQALNAYMTASEKVRDDQVQFEMYAEPAFLEAIKICEAIK